MDNPLVGSSLVVASVFAKLDLVKLRKNLIFQLVTKIMFASGWIITNNNIVSNMADPQLSFVVQVSIMLLVAGAALNRHQFDKGNKAIMSASLLFMGAWALINLSYILDENPEQESKIRLGLGSALVIAGIMFNRRAETKNDMRARIIGHALFAGGWYTISTI